MKILFLGDIVGRSARDEVIARVPEWRRDYKLDAVIVNAENSAQGFGITPQICDDLYKAGVDCITTGNHIWGKREIIPHIDRDRRLLRPANMSKTQPGRGVTVIDTAWGKKIVVINLIGRLFMDLYDDPFPALDAILSEYQLGRNADAIFLDFHGEATSEKMAMGHYCDGRVSAVVGTHTHVPTADTQVLPKGTGYQTDAGMCGCFDGVIGMDLDNSLNIFLRRRPKEKLFPTEGPVTLCGVLFTLDPKTGLCLKAEALRAGGRMAQALPAVEKS